MIIKALSLHWVILTVVLYSINEIKIIQHAEAKKLTDQIILNTKALLIVNK